MGTKNNIKRRIGDLSLTKVWARTLGNQTENENLKEIEAAFLRIKFGRTVRTFTWHRGSYGE